MTFRLQGVRVEDSWDSRFRRALRSLATTVVRFVVQRYLVVPIVVGVLVRLCLFESLPLMLSPDSTIWPCGKGYLQCAQDILEKGDFGVPEVRTPGYPLVLAATFWVLGTSGRSVLILHHLLGLGTVVLVSCMAHRIAGNRVAILVGSLAAVDPWHLLLAHYAQSDVLMVFALAAAAAAILLFPAGLWIVQGLLVGGLSAAACLIRPTAQLLAPFLALAYLFTAPRQGSSVARSSGGFLIGFIVIAGPWLAFNANRGVLGFAQSADPLLFESATFHGLLREECIPADAPRNVLRGFRTMMAKGNNLAVERFRTLCRTGKLGKDQKSAWAWDSIRANPKGYLSAAWETLVWQMNAGPRDGNSIFDEYTYFARRITLDGRRSGEHAPNWLPGAGNTLRNKERFTMPYGKEGSLGARFIAPCRTGNLRGIPQIPLMISAILACFLAARLGRLPEAFVLAGSLVFVAFHVVILYPWQRYTLPSELLWYVSLAICAAAWSAMTNSRRSSAAQEVRDGTEA